MNDNSFTSGTESRFPSDDQMDALLSDFFRLEVPTELNQPFRRRVNPAATLATLTMAPELRVEQSRSRSVRFLAVAASVAAMTLAVLVVISSNHSSKSNAHDFANGLLKNPPPGLNSDKPMLVSPEGDSRTSTKAVSPDGVTLEETDGIELHPQD